MLGTNIIFCLKQEDKLILFFSLVTNNYFYFQVNLLPVPYGTFAFGARVWVEGREQINLQFVFYQY